jgi:hypothetical protein
METLSTLRNRCPDHGVVTVIGIVDREDERHGDAAPEEERFLS